MDCVTNEVRIDFTVQSKVKDCKKQGGSHEITVIRFNCS